jgi:hypothetical protein
MGGFPERDAVSIVKTAPVAEGCTVRTGRFVIEVQKTLVREYPHTEVARFEQHKQPMLLLWLRGERQVGRPPEVDLSSLVAPDDYLAGDRVRFFDGRRLVDRPLRALAGQRLELRLAENDRTQTPQWIVYGRTLTGAGAGAVGAAGVVVPPAGVVNGFIELLRRIDEDDLILLWKADVDALVAQLPGRAALAVHLASTKTVGFGAGTGLPAAELDLLIYVEPEPGCP